MLGRENDAAMFPPGPEPFRVKPMEIGNVKGVKRTPVFGGEGQLLLVGRFDKAGFGSRDHRDTPGTKRRDEVAVHGVFVEVDADSAHKRGSAPVLLFEGLGRLRLCFEVGVDFRPLA